MPHLRLCLDQLAPRAAALYVQCRFGLRSHVQNANAARGTWQLLLLAKVHPNPKALKLHVPSRNISLLVHKTARQGGTPRQRVDSWDPGAWQNASARASGFPGCCFWSEPQYHMVWSSSIV